jgi:hypothetical protein
LVLDQLHEHTVQWSVDPRGLAQDGRKFRRPRGSPLRKIYGRRQVKKLVAVASQRDFEAFEQRFGAREYAIAPILGGSPMRGLNPMCHTAVTILFD